VDKFRASPGAVSVGIGINTALILLFQLRRQREATGIYHDSVNAATAVTRAERRRRGRRPLTA
jgi:hypothetical protein